MKSSSPGGGSTRMVATESRDEEEELDGVRLKEGRRSSVLAGSGSLRLSDGCPELVSKSTRGRCAGLERMQNVSGYSRGPQKVFQ